MKRILFALAVAVAAGTAAADDAPRLTIKDHHFVPERLEVPASVKFKLIVENDDTTPEEFESYTLDREKLVPPGGKITLSLGPLDAGEYPFFGEFHADTAQGRLVVK